MVVGKNQLVWAFFEGGFWIWNKFIEIAMKLFNTSPLEASSGTLVGTISPIYHALLGIGLSLAVVFFLIAIIKETISAPHGQQGHRLILSGLKYAVILGILSNLWEIMGAIINITDQITSSSSSTVEVTLSVSEELKSLIDQAFASPPAFEITDISGSLGNWLLYSVAYVFCIILGIVTLFVIVASCISILSSAFQRIIKPLIIMPFAAIMVAAGAGTGDSERVMWNFFKTFFGFCLSGAAMIICIRLGVALCNGILVFPEPEFGSDYGSVLKTMVMVSLQVAITPIVVAGLIKGVDGIIQRFL